VADDSAVGVTMMPMTSTCDDLDAAPMNPDGHVTQVDGSSVTPMTPRSWQTPVRHGRAATTIEHGAHLSARWIFAQPHASTC